MYELSVTVDLTDVNDIEQVDARIVKAVGLEPESSGYGFGQRDIQFTCASKKAAVQARARIMQTITTVANVSITRIDD